MQFTLSPERLENAVAQRTQNYRFLAISRLAALFIALATIFSIPGCAPAPNLIGVDAKPTEPKAEAFAEDIKIFIATTRAPSDQEGEFFSSKRSLSVNFASVDVSIPPSHQTGTISLPRNPPPDPNRHFVIQGETRFAGSDDFVRRINDAIGAQPKDARSALVFIHGYNTNLTEAVVRFAQLVEDSGFRGIPVLFSWPSARRTIDYVTDLNSAAYSRDGFAHTVRLLNRTRLEGYDLIAHSMGNFVMMETARTAALRGEFDELGRLNSIVMASPDIDVWLFTKQLAALPMEVREKMHILVSQDDQALKASRLVAGNYPRVGAADVHALSKLGVTVVDLTQIKDTSSLHHSKFADSPAIVQLLGSQLAQNNNLSTEKSSTGIFLERAGGVVRVSAGP